MPFDAEIALIEFIPRQSSEIFAKMLNKVAHRGIIYNNKIYKQTQVPTIGRDF